MLPPKCSQFVTLSVQKQCFLYAQEPSFTKDISNPEGLLWGVLHRASTVKAGQEDNQGAHNSSSSTPYVSLPPLILSARLLSLFASLGDKLVGVDAIAFLQSFLLFFPSRLLIFLSDIASRYACKAMAYGLCWPSPE
ncbi:hypothetical protein DAI22_03g098500 [Oryza sativa Japonica Group]|nr:hypothetical protein DAI22_03g098500 [Oryza sativa Japonica Group]